MLRRLRPRKIAFRRTPFIAGIGAAAFLTTLSAIERAQAQQTIPLDFLNGNRLGIKVGVDGQQPVEYLFDTGSTPFNIGIGNGASPAWFPATNLGQTPVANLIPYLYGAGEEGYLLARTTVNSVQFVSSAGTTISYSTPNLPVTVAPYLIETNTPNNVPGELSPTPINNPKIAQLYAGNDFVTGHNFYENLTWQANIQAGNPAEEGQFYGTFGAGAAVDDLLGRAGAPNAVSVLGNLTKTGYVVEANGSPTTPGGCGQACLIVGLTPQLRAQFFTALPWQGGSQGAFPLSGANAAPQYSTMFKYVLGSGPNLSSANMLTLLDTGNPNIALSSASLLSQAIANNTISGSNVNTGVGLSISGAQAGAQATNLVAGSDPSTDVTLQANAAGSAETAVLGISFYMKNAVMYDLANEAIGYTPFYVTTASFLNGLTVTSDMNPLGVAGVISGQNGVAIEPNGIAYLTATNTYTGATTVEKTGWLGVGGPGSISASSNVDVDGTLDLFHSTNANDELIRSLSGSGVVVLGPTTLTLTAASGNFSGNIDNIYASEDAAQPYPTPTSSSNGYGGVIVAGGTETFSGDNSYAGATGIGEAGGLILTGTLENSDVLNAGYFQNDGLTREMTLSTGTVAGNGNFAGGLVAASGYVVPGDRGQATPGHMAVGTLLAMGSDATYVVRVVGSDASRIDVNGPATINGSTFEALVGSPTQLAAVGQRYTVLTASDGVGGQFGAVTGNLGSAASQYPFLDADLGYTPDAVSLDLVRSGIPFVAAAQSPNEYGVATGLDTMNPSLPVSRAAASLNFASAPRAFNALAGDLHSSLRTDLIQDAYGLGQAAIARLDAAECAGTAPGQVVSYGDGQPAANDGGCHSERRAAWIQAYDSWSRNGGANGVSGLLGSSGGFVGGVDAPAPGGWRIGGLLGYAHSRFSADSTAASGSADNVSVGAYAGRLWGPIGLKLGADYSWNMVSTTRTVSLPGFWDQTAANYGGGTAQAFADLSYRLAFQGVSTEPFANLAYVNQDMSSFNESGFGGAALHGNSEDMGVTFTTLGARFARAFTLGQYALEADASVGYRHAFGAVTPTTYESFLLGGVGFDTAGVPVPQDLALLNLGARVRLSDSVKVGVAYVGEYGGSYSQNGVKGNVDWSF